MGDDEITLLEDELQQLSVRSSIVAPKEGPYVDLLSLDKKTLQSRQFFSTIKSIWKTNRKFEIEVVGQDLFLISFEDEEYLEFVLEGCPWFFWNQIIVFDRLLKPVDRRRTRLNHAYRNVIERT